MNAAFGLTRVDVVPLGLAGDRFADLVAANEAAKLWCAEVNAAIHSEICAIPAQRLTSERELLAQLPSLRAEFGAKPTTRKVDKLSCVRFGSGRYSVPVRLIGTTVTVLVDAQTLRVIEPVTGEIHAEHTLVPPGEAPTPRAGPWGWGGPDEARELQQCSSCRSSPGTEPTVGSRHVYSRNPPGPS